MTVILFIITAITITGELRYDVNRFVPPDITQCRSYAKQAAKAPPPSRIRDMQFQCVSVDLNLERNTRRS